MVGQVPCDVGDTVTWNYNGRGPNAEFTVEAIEDAGHSAILSNGARVYPQNFDGGPLSVDE